MNQQSPKAGMKFNEPLSYREQVAIATWLSPRGQAKGFLKIY